MNTVCHEIGGIRFQSTSDAMIPHLHGDSFSPFLVENRSPDVFLHFRNVGGEINDNPEGPMTRHPEVIKLLDKGFDSDRTYWADDNCVLVRDFQKRELHFFYCNESGGYLPEIQGYAPEWYVSANLWQVFSGFLPGFDAIMLHSAGAVLGERAVLFLASDEGGKTTAVKKVEGARVLSDDHVVLRRKGSGFRAYATPLGLLGDGPFEAELGGIFLLEKGEAFELASLASKDLIPWIWAEHGNYTFFLPKSWRVAVFKLLCDLCRRVPVYRMRFSRGHVDRTALEKSIRIAHGQA